MMKNVRYTTAITGYCQFWRYFIYFYLFIFNFKMFLIGWNWIDGKNGLGRGNKAVKVTNAVVDPV